MTTDAFDPGPYDPAFVEKVRAAAAAPTIGPMTGEEFERWLDRLVAEVEADRSTADHHPGGRGST